VIPYDPKTRMIKAQASVGGQAVRFLVDTGASLTTVPTAVADRLGLRKKTNPRAKVTTASGVLEVEVVELPSLKLGKIRLRKVRAAVLDLPGESLAGTGLLGLNALQRLNMEIDSENSRLILKQRRKRR
jgi:aspartyl protease family protein